MFASLSPFVAVAIDVWSYVWPLVDVLVPILVGAVSVPIFGAIKTYVLPWIDRQAAFVQQLLLGVQVYLLGLLTQLLGTALPPNLAGFELSTVESLIAAGVAFAIHAGRKATGHAST